jgi:hypothetical protein
LDVHRFVSEMCTRFRVSPAFGQRLRPLIENAARSSPEKQRLLLELVERSFAEEGRRAELERSGCTPEDWRVLASVAGVLHGWHPPRWFDRWEDEPRREPEL